MDTRNKRNSLCTSFCRKLPEVFTLGYFVGTFMTSLAHLLQSNKTHIILEFIVRGIQITPDK